MPKRRLSNVFSTERLSHDETLVAPTETSEIDAKLRGDEHAVVLSDGASENNRELEWTPSKFQSSTKLHRSPFVLILVFCYAVFAIFAWVVTCILSLRPLSGPKHYSARNDVEYTYDSGRNELPAAYAKTERWYRAARVIQAIVGVLSIPLTSTVCSRAAVIFVQRHRGSVRLTLRQLMVLADKGWVNPSIYGRVLTSWKRYGSSFLLISILLIVFGGLISPLQQAFLSSTTIKTPLWAPHFIHVLDIPDQWKFLQDDARDTNLVTTITRNSFLTASKIEPQPQLWPGAGLACAGDVATPASCGKGITFDNLTTSVDPFLAELPSDYSTGLIRQFVPRINSTARYENISATEYPGGCNQLPGAYYISYSGISNSSMANSKNETETAWSIEICMPADMTKSPWTSTRDRQDFSEVMYLNMTSNGDWDSHPTPPGGSHYRVTVNTTAGYFELPNYMNGGGAGPLLENDPNSECGNDCITEGLGKIA